GWRGRGDPPRAVAPGAARRALDRAGIDAKDVDVLAVATTTPECPIPSTAAIVAAELGSGAGAFDVNAACAGFVFGLAAVSALVESGVAHTVLLVGADTMSRCTDPAARGPAVLFGDGAGAVVLTGGPRTDPQAPGLVASDLVNDPEGVDLLVVPAGGSGRPASAETVARGEHYL